MIQNSLLSILSEFDIFLGAGCEILDILDLVEVGSNTFCIAPAGCDDGAEIVQADVLALDTGLGCVKLVVEDEGKSLVVAASLEILEICGGS